jgi:hypothetical protein
MRNLFLIIIFMPQLLYAEKIFHENFSNLNSWEYQHSGYPKIAEAIDTNIALKEDNTSLLKIYFPRDAYNTSDMGRRVEIKKHSEILTRREAERWYALSIYVPEDHPTIGYHILQQFHSVEDDGEMPRSPAFMIGIEKNGYWGGQIRYSVNKIDTFGNKSTVPKNIPWLDGNPKVMKGEWTHWVYNIIWDWKPGGKGKCRVWIKDSQNPNGKQVVDYYGQIGFNDIKPHYVRMGIYYAHYDLDNWSAEIEALTVFYDRFIVSDSLENFESMIYQENSDVVGRPPKSDIKIIPNPAEDFIMIESEETMSNFIIYDTLGRIVHENKPNDLVNGLVNISFMKPGIYFLKTKNDIQKFMVLR